MSHEVDPRVDKTRRRLRQALITLLQTETVDNISVQKLTSTAKSYPRNILSPL